MGLQHRGLGKPLVLFLGWVVGVHGLADCKLMDKQTLLC